MAEDIPDFAHGYLGRLAYIPSTTGNSLGHLHTTRLVADKPVFCIFAPSQLWVPAAKQPQQEPPPRQTNSGRVQNQERWLLRNHPEAFVGTGRPFRTPLAQSLARYAHLDTGVPETPLLALGVMLDASDARMNTSAPLLATAGGVSGQDLRLVTLHDVELGWEDGRQGRVAVVDFNDDDPDDETTWARDAVPISKIRTGLHEVQYEAIRWLFVQKQTSTTLLEPEYRAVPIEPEATDNTAPSRPSRIVPKHMFTVTVDDTAGHLHSDVAFNPTFRRKPAQVALVDECGYFYVWDAKRGRYHGRQVVERVQVVLGHVKDGIKETVPRLSMHVPQPHGVLFVGRSEDEDVKWDEGEEREKSNRSTTLLVWNALGMALVDMPTGTFWKRLAFLSRWERIVDVQSSPSNKDQFFVLTNRRIVWFDVSLPEGSNVPHKNRTPAILIKSPHDREQAEDGLRLASCVEGVGSDDEGAVVLIYSTSSKLFTVYWFWRRTALKLPQFHRQTLMENGDLTERVSDIQTLCIRPCESRDVGDQGDIHFYQLLIQGRDLGIRTTFCASFVPRPELDVAPPSVPVGKKWPSKRKWRHRWRQWYSSVEQAFVVPDNLGDLTQVARQRVEEREGSDLVLGLDVEKNTTAESKVLPPKWVDFAAVGAELERSLEDVVAPRGHVAVSELFDTMQAEIRRWQASGRQMPLLQLSNLLPNHDILSYKIDMSGWDDGIRRLLSMAGEGVTLVRTAPLSKKEAVGSMVSIDALAQDLGPPWLDSLPPGAPEKARAWRQSMVDHVVPALALASYAVKLNAPRETLLPHPSSSQPSSSQTIPDSSIPPSSQISIKSSRSSKSTSARRASALARSKSHAAIARLRALAGGAIDDSSELARAPQHPLLDLWPETPGVPLAGYVSSVAQAAERRFDGVRALRERRARVSAKQARRAEKYGGGGGGGMGGSQSSRATTPFASGMRSGDEMMMMMMDVDSVMQSREQSISTQPLPQHLPQSMLPSRTAAAVKAEPGRPFMSSQLYSTGIGMDSSGTMPTIGTAPSRARSQSQSQSQGGLPVIMSQPVAGAFGDVRKKIKKGPGKIKGFK